MTASPSRTPTRTTRWSASGRLPSVTRFEVTNGDYDSRGGSRDWVQVSRLGNPLVNEVIIPLGQKDRFNRTGPAKDATNFGQYVLEPELAAVLNALFGVGAPTENRTDLLPLLTGFEGLNQHKGRFAGTPVDTLKVNLGTAPAATEDRFGVIGGDVAGFPNGRRLGDDVVDISLQVVAGLLAPAERGRARRRGRRQRRAVRQHVPLRRGPVLRVRLRAVDTAGARAPARSTGRLIRSRILGGPPPPRAAAALPGLLREACE